MSFFSFLRKGHAMEGQLDAYVDGELSAAEAARFEAHLATCDACSAAVADSRVLAAAMSDLPELVAPRSFRLTEAMVAAPTPAPAPRQERWYPRAAAGVMAAAFAVFAVLVVVDTPENGNPGMSAATELSSGGAPEADDDEGAAATGPVDGPVDEPPQDMAGEDGSELDPDGVRASGEGDFTGTGVSLLAEDADDDGLDAMRVAQIAALGVSVVGLGALVVALRRPED